MAAERMPHRPGAALIASLLAVCAGAPGARAFTTPDTQGGGAFANPFPAAGGEPAPAQPGTLAPPNYQYQGNLPVVMGGLPTPGFTVTPALTIEEMFNDNIFQTETNRRADLITLISPSLTVGANTPRLNLSLTYAPTLEYYARTHSQDGIIQQAFGVGSLIVVPDTFFVNARVFATVAPTNGGLVGGGLGAPLTAGTVLGGGPQTLSRQGRTQIYGVSVSPYLIHRFGTFGTGTLGLTLDQTYTSSTGGGGGSANASTAEANAQFQSGSYFGRVQDTLSLDASRTSGTGALNGSQQESVTNQLGYALTRQLQVFGRLGWENITYGAYAGGAGTHINDAIWGFGGTYEPNPDSSITLSYTHQQGITGIQAQAHYAVTARTVVTASYTHSLQTNLQYVATQLGQAAVGPNGQPILGPNGAPLILVYSALGVQNTLYRTDTLQLGATTLLDRDTISLNVDRVTETPVSAGTATAAGGLSQDVTTGTATWTRALSERATMSASFTYGTGTVGTAGGAQDLFSAAATFNYVISRTLTGTATYQYYRRSSTQAGFSMYDNILIVGLTKTF